jgi:putative ABC transport system substrate-binding protein
MRLLGLVLALGLALTPLVGGAQQAGKLYRIGSLVPGTAADTAPLIAVFRQSLSGLGYVEGRNLVMERRYSETAELHAQNADELTRLGVDVIVVTTTTSALRNV